MNRLPAPQSPTGSGRRVPRERVNGVLLLDKPRGMTSNGALQAAKRLLNASKAGHTGTLDPLASGLLPLCFGEATKFSGELLTADKRYRAQIRFGVRTTTGDAEGEVISESVPAFSRAELDRAIAKFIGTIAQVPPRHAALKYQGRAYYEYAREGVDIPRPAREVTIREIMVETWEPSLATLLVHCAKGTYIRSLADDLGEALGCGAHLLALRRIAIGRFLEADACDLDRLRALGSQERRELLLPVDALVSELPALHLQFEAALRLRRGQNVALERRAGSGLHRLYDADGCFMGLGVAQDDVLAPRRLLASALNESAVSAGTA